MQNAEIPILFPLFFPFSIVLDILFLLYFQFQHCDVEQSAYRKSPTSFPWQGFLNCFGCVVILYLPPHQQTLISLPLWYYGAQWDFYSVKYILSYIMCPQTTDILITIYWQFRYDVLKLRNSEVWSVTTSISGQIRPHFQGKIFLLSRILKHLSILQWLCGLWPKLKLWWYCK